MKAQEIEYMESIIEIFEHELISENKDLLEAESQSYAKMFELQYDLTEGNLADYYAQYFEGESFFITDYLTGPIIELSDLPIQQVEFQLRLKGNEPWLVSGQDEKIYLFAAAAIKNTDQYVVVYKPLLFQDKVEKITEQFGVDASIFIGDTRITSSIDIEGVDIVGKTLEPVFSKPLLERENTYYGIKRIENVPYISGYKSIGNEGEKPLMILFVGESLEKFNMSIRNMFVSITLLGLILILISTLLSSKWLQKNIVLPLSAMTNWLSRYDAMGSHFTLPVHFMELDQFFETMTVLLNRLEFAREDVERIAYYDELTKLPNRFLLMKRHLEPSEKAMLQLCQSLGYLIYIDADNIKMVNDVLGHRIGDRLIVAIGEYLKRRIAPYKDVELYRVGGDEFVIWQKGSASEQEIIEMVTSIKELTSEDLDLQEYGFTSTLSIGIAKCDGTAKNFDELLRNAEIAMYQVKHSTKNDFAFYERSMSQSIEERQAMENDLKQAIERGELVLEYQPKYNLKKNICDSLEALIRWDNPARGRVSPLAFIPIAEETGQIIQIGDWVIEQACIKIKELNARSQHKVSVSVNVSPVQILKDDFVQHVIKTMIMYGIEPQTLELEITESVLVESLSTSVEKLRQLLVLGVGISIDDFGKGYSSLAYLRHLPISTLKIDKVFIDDIIESDQVMVGDIIDLGHNMGLKIVAEGIEIKEQLTYLRQMNCDIIQGYYYSKPLASDEVADFIQKNHQI
jgi:diguanylate cyclase (GGDEF)-like protein